MANSEKVLTCVGSKRGAAFREASAAPLNNESNVYGTTRKDLHYYKYLRCLLVKYACVKTTKCETAKHIVDVGSALPPFIEGLAIEEKTIVVPYVPSVSEEAMTSAMARLELAGITVVPKRLDEWNCTKKFDVAMSSQVIEHVPDPSAFLRRMFSLGKLVIISAPYNWPRGPIGHVSHRITLETLVGWAGRRPDAYVVVTEPTVKAAVAQRVITLWATERRPGAFAFAH